MVGEASSPRCLERLRGLRARWCLRGLEWVLGRSPGRYLGTFWSPGRALWDIWEALGSLLEPLGDFLELLGGFLGVIWVILGVVGRLLRLLGALPGPLGGILGGSWEALGSILGVFHVLRTYRRAASASTNVGAHDEFHAAINALYPIAKPKTAPRAA